MNPDPNPDALVRNVLVLLSGGQDSTTCLFWAKRTYPEARIHALTVFYGQRHQAEIGAACEIALRAGCATHDVVDLSPVFEGAESALAGGRAMALLASGGLKDEAMPQGLPTSFVPGRNLVFLAVAAARAGMHRCNAIVTGVCQTDYSGYPDCRSEFIAAMERAINQAMPTELQPVMVDAPLMYRTKAQTVQLAASLPGCLDALAYSVTCYNGLRPGCGSCPACELRAKGFEEAGVKDPAVREATKAQIDGVVRLADRKRPKPSGAFKVEEAVRSAYGEPTPKNDTAIAVATILWPLAGNPKNKGQFIVEIGEGELEVAVPAEGYRYNLADEERKLPTEGVRMDAESLAELAERAGVAEFIQDEVTTGVETPRA